MNPNNGRKNGKWKRNHMCDVGKTRWERSGDHVLIQRVYVRHKARWMTRSAETSS